MAETRTAVVALFLISLVFAAASVPAVSAYGCYDDCYNRCANGKEDPACTTMCNEACVVDKSIKDGASALHDAAAAAAHK